MKTHDNSGIFYTFLCENNMQAPPRNSLVRNSFRIYDYSKLMFGNSRGDYVAEVIVPNWAEVINDLSDENGIVLDVTDIIVLSKYHKHKEFKKWFDKDRFNYHLFSGALCFDYPDKFYFWFDKERFNYESYSNYLAEYLYPYFFDWYDRDKFNYEIGSEALARYCSVYFDFWFCEKFNQADIWALEEYCDRYFEEFVDFIKH